MNLKQYIEQLNRIIKELNADKRNDAVSSYNYLTGYIGASEAFLLDKDSDKLEQVAYTGNTKLNPPLGKVGDTLKENSFLKSISDAITLAKTTGKNYIAKADDTFKSYIDSDFKNWKLDKVSEARPETKLGVYELSKDGTYKDIFTSMSNDLDALCLTQHQIIEFCKAHKDLLGKDSSTMFLFKENDEFFVASVFVDSGGLDVNVFRFEDDNVWFVEYRHRVVLPVIATV